MASRDFRNLVVWQKAHVLVLDVYRLTQRFPREELYGLTSQIRRSSASVPTNIAESCGRRTSPDRRKFLDCASGSLSEFDYQLLLTRDLAYLDDATYNQLASRIAEVGRMLSGLIGSLDCDSNSRQEASG